MKRVARFVFVGLPIGTAVFAMFVGLSLGAPFVARFVAGLIGPWTSLAALAVICIGYVAWLITLDGAAS